MIRQAVLLGVADYLAFARMLLGDPGVPALLRAETRALMTSNQLTPEQRAAARRIATSTISRSWGRS